MRCVFAVDPPVCEWNPNRDFSGFVATSFQSSTAVWQLDGSGTVRRCANLHCTKRLVTYVFGRVFAQNVRVYEEFDSPSIDAKFFGEYEFGVGSIILFSESRGSRGGIF